MPQVAERAPADHEPQAQRNEHHHGEDVEGQVDVQGEEDARGDRGDDRPQGAGRAVDALRRGRPPGRRSARDHRVEGRTQERERDALAEDQRNHQQRVLKERVEDPGGGRAETPQDHEDEGTALIRPASGDGREHQDAEPEDGEGQADEAEVGAEPGHPQAPDHLVGPRGEVAPHVDDDRRQEEPVPQGSGRARERCGGGSQPRARVRPGAGGTSVRPNRGGRRIRFDDVHWKRPPHDREAEQDGGRDHRDAAEDEREDVPATECGPDGPEGGPEQEPTHRRSAVEAERRAALVGGRGVEDVGARGRVVGGRGEAGESARQHEGRNPGDHERHRDHDGRHQEAAQHQDPLVAAIGEPAEDRLAHEPRGRPGSDDPAQRRDVDSLLAQVERHDREERAEAQPEDRLGEQDGEDRKPPGEPPAETPGAGVAHAHIVPSRRSPRPRGRGRSGRPSPPSRPGRRRASGRRPRGRPCREWAR